MKSNNYIIYCSQLKDIIIKYPNLSIIEVDSKKVLKGILDIPNDDKIIVGSYLIEIHFADGFPFRFPKLFEKGGAIINDIDWHKYPDESCCITVLPDEIVKCKHGISVLEFIEKYCFSFLANHKHRILEGHYLNGEYAHGLSGFIQFYSVLLKTTDTSIWKEYYKHVFRQVIFLTDRNGLCFCGSQLKFKKCHKIIFDTMRDIGQREMFHHFKLIIV